MIDDHPADTDAFGPHGRVARTIAELIRTEPGGKTIGLEGQWGRGKSSIVRMLQKAMPSSGPISIAVFDAWAHQGDPLRRSFLERLVDHLQRRDWVRTKYWNDRKDELARRRKVTDTITAPRLEPAGKVLVLWTLLFPIGIALFAAGLRNHEPARNGNTWMGLLLSAAPAIWLVVAMVWQRFRREKNAGDKPGEENSLWSLIISKAVSVTSTKTIETPEPTSVEFGSIFSSLMEEALTTEKKLVIILDNLDRVAAADALDIWSTLQTFLQFSEHEKPSWLDRLWVILPYDRGAIERLWRKPGSGGRGAAGTAQEGQATLLASSFLDKSIQVRFEVPPPVLSKWDAYIRALLATALPDHSNADYYAVYRVYSLQRPPSVTTPTPRDLKLFTNQVGALHRQWGDEFPLSFLAYYALLRIDTERVDLAKELVVGAIPPPEVQLLLGDHVREAMAALWFNVDSATAQQLLLNGHIEDALVTGNGEALSELREIHNEAFWKVLEQLTADRGAELFSDSRRLAMAAKCLEESGLLSEDEPESDTIRKLLQRFARAIAPLMPFDEAAGTGIAALSRIVLPDAEGQQALATAIANSRVRLEQEQDPSMADPREWIKAYYLVALGWQTQGLSIPTIRCAAVDANRWVFLAAAIEEQDPAREMWGTLTPAAEPQEIRALIDQAITAGTFSSDLLSNLRVTSAVFPDFEWGNTGDAVFNRLHGGVVVPTIEMAMLAEATWEIRTRGGAPFVQRLASEGDLLHHFYQAASENNQQTMAWCLRLMLEVNATLTAPTVEVGNSAAGATELNNFVSQPSSRPELLSKFVDLAIQSKQYEFVFPLLDSGAATPFVTEPLKQFGLREVLPELFTAEEFLQRWRFLSSQVFGETPASFDSLVESMNVTHGLANSVLERAFDVSEASLYASLLRADRLDPRDQFAGWCHDGLTAVEATAWAADLQSGGETLDLLVELVRRADVQDMGTSYRDGLLQFATWLAGGNELSSKIDAVRDELLRPLGTVGDRDVFRRNVLDEVAGSGKTIAPPFFDFFGDELADADLLRRTPEIVRQLFTPLLRSRNAPGLNWLADIVRKDPDLVTANSDRPAAKDFQTRLAAAARKQDDATEALGRLMQSLGLKSTEPNDDDEEEGSDD